MTLSHDREIVISTSGNGESLSQIVIILQRFSERASNTLKTTYCSWMFFFLDETRCRGVE